MNFSSIPGTPVSENTPRTIPAQNIWDNMSSNLLGGGLQSPQYPSHLAFWHNPHSLPHHPSPQAESSHGQAMSSISLPEQKKHKRTRSGCFTCRTRRVKCDEHRPICDRCSKGSRECVYPPPSTPKGSHRSSTKDKQAAILESESEDDARSENAEREKSDFPTSQSREQTSRQTDQASNQRRGAPTITRRRTAPALDSRIHDKSASPASDMTAMSTASHSPGSSSLDSTAAIFESLCCLTSSVPDNASLSDNVRFFLRYRTQNISYSHYLMKSNATRFIQHDMMRHAVEYEPLLYAVVAFSAYHYSVAHPNGKLYTFLQYYHRSVSSLLQSIKNGDPHNDAMILTMLQLATFEEFVGDWVNLVDHHHAAHRMITELYTPETIVLDEFHRHILLWHTRYDVIVGLMAGNAVTLPREWFVEAEKFACQDSANHPDDINKKLLAWAAITKRYAMDLASFLAKGFQGLVSQNEFLTERQMILETLDRMSRFVDSMADPQYLMTSFPHKTPLTHHDIVDPYVPGLVYGGQLFEVDLCRLELENCKMIYEYQLGSLTQSPNPSVLSELALQQCRLIETLDRLPNKPPLFPVLVHNSLGMLCLFLPHNDQHKLWCRKRLAQTEQLGYLFPATFRNRMADIWNIPELTEWWLPNREGFRTLIQDIREWTIERTTTARDPFHEAVRDIRSMFGRMDVEDESSLESSPSAFLSGYHGQSPHRSPT
ncbi:hypothetical protein FQN57_005991 [Myotisia sp. PD_48]|nr:hypothetical protein FQN57_005991 [Myotisia sp. PD_48]